MKTYLIDGNNLIFKIDHLKELQKIDKQKVREKLIFLIEDYFINKKHKVKIFFDGFETIKINSNISKIIYSNDKPADYYIKEEIDNAKNPKNLVIVSSDFEIQNKAKVCSAEILNSEIFAKELLNKKDFSNDNKSEEEKIKKLQNEIDEFKKLFGDEK
ncbi:MAG: hypothetical protein STSR0008_04650 [Ignavibacterium sp.]